MNSHKNLETLLRGSRLRPPSAKVRAALFGAATADAVPAQALPPAGRFQVWFAPLAAATVVLLSLAPVWLPGGGPADDGVAVAALGGGGEPPLGLVEHNTLPRSSFHSTIGAAVAPSFGSLLLRQTNILAR